MKKIILITFFLLNILFADSKTKSENIRVDGILDAIVFKSYLGVEEESPQKLLSPKEQCIYAGYSLSQMEALNYKCLGLKDLKPYMSTNEYYSNIKLGEKIKNYNAFKKINSSKIEEHKMVLNKFQLESYLGDVYYFKNKNVTIGILTRFGLIDVIIVFLKNQYYSQIEEDLRKKYKFISSSPMLKYSHFNMGLGQSDALLFKNGTDNIMLYNNWYQDSVIVYTSNAYIMLDNMSKEKVKAKKNKVNNISKEIDFSKIKFFLD